MIFQMALGLSLFHLILLTHEVHNGFWLGDFPLVEYFSFIIKSSGLTERAMGWKPEEPSTRLCFIASQPHDNVLSLTQFFSHVKREQCLLCDITGLW